MISYVAGWLVFLVTLGVMVGVAAMVQGRLPARARGLMWGGVGLLVIGQMWSVLQVYVFSQLRLPMWGYSVASVAGTVVHLVAVVLLLLAIGRAATSARPGQPVGTGYPPVGGPPVGQAPAQPFDQQRQRAPWGESATGADQPYGRPQPFGQPGTWGDEGTRR